MEKLTIRDIARMAGVSTTAVSFVLNGRSGVSESTRKRVQEIIQQNPEERLEYVVTGESGPDHDKHFTVEVHLNSNVIGKGGGRRHPQQGRRRRGLHPGLQ